MKTSECITGEQPCMVKYSPAHRLRAIQLISENAFERAQEIFFDERPATPDSKRIRQQISSEFHFIIQSIWNLSCGEDEWIDRYEELISHDGKMTLEEWNAIFMKPPLDEPNRQE